MTFRQTQLSDCQGSRNTSRQLRECEPTGRSRIPCCLASQLEEGQDKGGGSLNGKTVLHHKRHASAQMHCSAGALQNPAGILKQATTYCNSKVMQRVGSSFMDAKWVGTEASLTYSNVA